MVMTIFLTSLIRPYLGSSRTIHPGQKIHSSVTLANSSVTKKYTPEARPLEGSVSFSQNFWDPEWKDLRTSVEFDLDERLEEAIEAFVTNPNNANALQILCQIGQSSKRGRFFRFFQQFKRGSVRS